MAVLMEALRDTTQREPEPQADPDPERAFVDACRAPHDPLALLSRMVEVRDLVAEVERVAVRRARAEGASWATVGAALGVSGQAVAKKYGA